MPKTVKLNTCKVKDLRSNKLLGPTARAKDAAVREVRRIENYRSELLFHFTVLFSLSPSKTRSHESGG